MNQGKLALARSPTAGPTGPPSLVVAYLCFANGCVAETLFQPKEGLLQPPVGCGGEDYCE